MREIKFRAWLTLSDYDDDGNDKDYYGMATKISVHHDGDIGFSVREGMQVFGDEVFQRALDTGTVDEYEDWCLWEGQFELMQYTGLKDKNGVEIYEGDIVDFYSRRDYDPTAPFYINRRKRKVVKWVSNPQKNTINIRQTADPNLAYHEVIGNIYENPELLTPKKDGK